MLHKPLGDNLGHDLIGVVDALAALTQPSSEADAETPGYRTALDGRANHGAPGRPGVASGARPAR